MVVHEAQLENQWPIWEGICTQLAMALQLLQKEGRLQVDLKDQGQDFAKTSLTLLHYVYLPNNRKHFLTSEW